jgi:hypothetical protein
MTFISPPLETVKHTDERRTDNENDDMTFVSPPLETVKHTDERRTDSENDDCPSFFCMFYCL